MDQIRRAIDRFVIVHEEVLAACVFGSYAKGKAGEASDIDVALLIEPPNAGFSPIEHSLRYCVELEGMLHKRVDVVLLNAAPPILRHQILREGVLVFERDKSRVRRFIGDALVEFYDEIVLLEAVQKTAIRRHLLGQ